MISPRAVLLLAGGAGAFTAFGQAPYDVPLVLLAGMVGAVLLFRASETPRQAALVGWAFGTGYFMHALRWIVSPFLVDVATHGWMAPFALIFLSAGLALFWGAAFGLARWLSGRYHWSLILCWPAFELVRAYIFTGFPWAMPSQALVGVMAGQALAWVGPYALNLWLVALAAVIAWAVSGAGARRGAGVILAVGVAPVLILAPVASPGPATEYTIRLIQPNAVQRDKWNPEMIPIIFDRQLAFTSAVPRNGGRSPDLVIWSETSIPWPLDLAGTALVEIAQAGGAGTVALGALRRTQTRHFNSMVVLTPQGAISQTYDKHHLVPFGEYMPLGDLLSKVGIHGLAARDGHGYSQGTGPVLLDFGALGQALPLICYEAVFAHDVSGAPDRPAFLIQITNDAWFGNGAGPKQHLAQARMRAIEQGLPLARAANTGISAMIDPKGRVIASLPLNSAGFLDVALPAPDGATLYSRTGDWPFAFVLLVLLAVATIRQRQTS